MELELPKVVAPKEVAQSLAHLWSPKVIGEVDDSYLKVAKVQGSFGWHSHEHEDEVFFILSGKLKIELEGDAVQLAAGEMYIVPKGAQHNPVAEEECLILLIEKKSTLHTGNTVTDKTRSIDEQLQ